MERVQFGTDLDLSRIIYGMWRIKDDPDHSPAHVQAKIEACLEQGITSFDQADIYGDYGAESVLGAVLKASPQLRDQMQIVTKCNIVAPIGIHSDKPVKYYDTSAAYLKGAVDRSLSQMTIETIDLLLLHRPDPFMDADETAKALDDIVASGKVRALGVSNFKPHDTSLLQSRLSNPLVTNQVELSLLEPSAFTNGDLAYCQEHRIPVMAWSPLGGGRLFETSETKLSLVLDNLTEQLNCDRATLALAWLLAHPAKILPVMGTNNIARIRAFSDALKIDMDRQTWFRIYEGALGREVA